MRYYSVGRDKFIENGRSVLRIAPVLTMPDPVRKNRTVKICEVLQVVREVPHNPAPPRGAMISLSFPNEKANADEYTWGPTDPAQLPFEVRDRKVNLDALSAKRN